MGIISASQTWIVLVLALFLASFSHWSSGDTAQTLVLPVPSHHRVPSDYLLNRVLRWRNQVRASEEREFKLDFRTGAAAVLCFASVSIASAGGLGGGALFLPILILVAGMDLKTATTFTAFMVTGGAVSNVYNMFFKGEQGRQSPINYEIALLSEPCLLLGVTAGVICHVMFPEWLVTLLFVSQLAWSTYKTWRAGVVRWNRESEEKRERLRKLESKEANGQGGEGIREPLLQSYHEERKGTLTKKVVMLLLIWVSFLLLNSLRGDEIVKSLTDVERCGVAYWLITVSQVPLALLLTAFVLCRLSTTDQDLTARTMPGSMPKIVFPAAALMSGVLSGLFGIGGGLIINPVLIQLGIHPQVTAATSSFIVLFSSSMSSVQYLMLGMKGVKPALCLAAGCFVASLVGLILIQRAIVHYGRPSLIIFTVGAVMFLSIVSMTWYGAMNVWRDFVVGRYMGFRLPC